MGAEYPLDNICWQKIVAEMKLNRSGAAFTGFSHINAHIVFLFSPLLRQVPGFQAGRAARPVGSKPPRQRGAILAAIDNFLELPAFSPRVLQLALDYRLLLRGRGKQQFFQPFNLLLRPIEFPGQIP
jgi:hypothetical protein